MKSIKRILTIASVAILVVVFTMLSTLKANASANDFYFKDFTSDYYLTKNAEGVSSLHVKEVLTAVFPDTNQNHGITRSIPYLNQNGNNRVIKSKEALNLSVLRNGQAERVSKIEDSGMDYTIYIGSANEYVHGEQVYTLEYDFTNVITEFDADGQNISGENSDAVAFQELYWDTNGTDWSQRFDKVTARLHTSDEILASMGAPKWCYVGSYGDKGEGRCTMSELSDGISFTASDLKARENLTFVTEFKPGTFKVVREKSYVLFIVFGVVILLIALLSVRLYLKWKKKAREQAKLYKSLFVVPEYQAPADPEIHVAEGEQLYFGKTKPSYVATLLELAVSKKVEIVKIDEKQKNDFNWAVKVNTETSKLSESQVLMLRILANKSSVEKGDEIEVKNHTATKTLADYAKNYTKKATAKLVQKGLLAEKADEKSLADFASVAKMVFFKCIGIAFLLLMIFYWGERWIVPGSYVEIVGFSYMPFIIGGVILIYLIISTIVSQKTKQFSRYTLDGIKIARKLEGLELYIKMAEKDRMAFLQSVKGADTSTEGIVKLYEKLLPWACLFGQEKTWVKELAEYYKIGDVPEDISTEVLNGIIASNMLSSIDRSITKSISYRPDTHSDFHGGGSSFSSGGGGGGFSGGGGGGGGGGGW